MDLELVYNLMNIIILPFWTMMIVLPRWQGTRRVVNAIWPFAIVPVFYLITFIFLALDFEPVTLDFTLSGLNAMFGSEEATLVLWAHVLALDLFAGRWVYLDGQQRNIPQWVLSLLTFSVMMAGPAGLLFYFIARYLRKDEGNDG